MQITSARVERGELILTVADPREAMRVAYTLKAGDYTISPAKKARSLDANAYAWVLMDKLSAETGIPKLEIYQNTIRKIGGVSETVCVKNEAVDQLRQGWEHNGLGWQTETIPSKLEGCTNVILHYGSSVYDPAQMGRMIDNLIEDCRALKIETLPPEKLALLLEDWGR